MWRTPTRDWRQRTRQATLITMRCLPVGDITPGMILARPARALDGSLIYKPGLVLEAKQLGWLKQAGLHELWVVRAGEAVPDPTVPEYLDRYGPDFAAKLQGVYSKSLVNRTMQGLFLAALAHATECYRRYRLDEREEE
jgi:hypothetical protein